MAYQTLENISNIGISELLSFPNLDTPSFYPALLFGIFIILTSLLFFREVSRTGRGNFLASLAVSGYVTVALAVLLSLMGLIQTEILITIIVATLLFQVIYLLTNRSI